MKIPFTKMQALGNDFVIIRDPQLSLEPSHLPVKVWADRHAGIGFDQLLWLESTPKADYRCRIFNADGSEAEQCGNGLRCVGKLLHESIAVGKKNYTVETKAGIFPIEIINATTVKTALSPPKVEKLLKEVYLNQQLLKVSLLSLGNPHAIVKMDQLEDASATTLGLGLQQMEDFPGGINVGLMKIKNKRHVLLRTFERGVGETLACGSNACAAVVAGIMNGWLEPSTIVEFNTGKLEISWQGENTPVFLTGPAHKVFSGEIDIPA